jgi:superfamily II DNA/RNA helicase
MPFSAFKLDPTRLQGLNDLGFHRPTAIQAELDRLATIRT